MEKVVRYVEEVSGGEHSGMHAHHHHHHRKSSKKHKDKDDTDEKTVQKPLNEKILDGDGDAKQDSRSGSELKKVSLIGIKLMMQYQPVHNTSCEKFAAHVCILLSDIIGIFSCLLPSINLRPLLVCRETERAVVTSRIKMLLRGSWLKQSLQNNHQSWSLVISISSLMLW